MPAYTIQNTIKGPFTKDVRGEGSRGVSEIRTNLDIGRGGGSYSTTRTSEFKKKQEQKTCLFLWNKKILTVKQNKL